MELTIKIKKKLPGFNLQVDLSCEKEIVGILGASGSGKSMLLNCIAGLVKPDEGKIILNNRVLFDSQQKINLSPKERKTGFLFQSYALFPFLTIRENIGFGLKGLARQDKNAKVSELIERFHLKDMEKRYPAQISGGQQQRVAIARAMAVEPDILLLDEPFSALDDHLKNHMMKEMMASLKEFRGSTLYVTHNMEEAYRLCNRIAILNSGRVETFGLKQEVFQNPVSLETAKITGCKNISTAIRQSDKAVEVPDWGIVIKSSKKIGNEKGYVGIRANHIKLADDRSKENCYLAWIADESEAPFHTTLYLKLGAAPNKTGDYHIQWEISQDVRVVVQKMTQPITITLRPEYVFFVEK